MKNGRLMLVALTVLALVAMPALAEKPIKPPSPSGGNHYTMHILGKAQCDQNEDEDCWAAEECVNGNGGAACSNGRTMFVPLTTITSDICEEGTSLPEDITWADLQNGVRILVTDGEDFTIPDRDGTDGKATFTIPFGCYEVWARAHGKPNGCMEINSLTCYDCDDPSGVDCNDPSDFVQVDCNNDTGNDAYVLQGTLDVKRNKGGRQAWQNATDELLGDASVLTSTDNGSGSYFDFLWELFNNQMRNLELRFFEVECAE